MYRDKKGNWRFDEFSVLEVFLGFSVFGLLMGALFVFILYSRPPETALRAPVPVAMSEDEYRDQTRAIMTPFFARAAMMSEADVKRGDPAMRDLVESTQERMLALQRVPKEEQQTHLSFVLLLDKWKSALGGSEKDALQMTTDVRAAEPWLTEPPASSGTDAAPEPETQQ